MDMEKNSVSKHQSKHHAIQTKMESIKETINRKKQMVAIESSFDIEQQEINNGQQLLEEIMRRKDERLTASQQRSNQIRGMIDQGLIKRASSTKVSRT
jgi:hypothetical protein